MLPPDNWYDPLVMPGLLTLFGAFIWWLGWLGERSGKSAPWKWVAFVFLLAAMWNGFGWMNRMSDQLYYMSLPGHTKRWIVPHYAAFFLPLVVMIGCVVMHFLPKKATVAPATE